MAQHHFLIALLVLVLIPLLDRTSQPVTESLPTTINDVKRDYDPVNVCLRWAQQSAIVNGTLYLYGGQAQAQQGQDSNTWNNNFLSVDLQQDWQISSPSLKSLPQPNGPPAVALGYLWNSHDSLFLYGGEVSWKPVTTPPSSSVWEYSFGSQTWIEHSNPETSDGTNAPVNNDPVQRAAEGAGANVPSLGRGFYFGGHLDSYTTQGWSNQVPRLYLQSLLEFTFPGYANDQINTLHNDRLAGTAGNYRNITEGGFQPEGGFTARADGVLVYVPGYGKEGILIALAGGTNDTYTQMNVLDVYDIAISSWYKQSTIGSYPALRVNPCSVVAAAADGSSYNVYMFGGQNLIPYGNQTQFSDMWILSVPSFTWIEVKQDGQSVPYGRSGHTCNIWDAQMVMVGGYTGPDLSCESPGVYVYDLSNLQWLQKFTATSANSSSNPLSQQVSQLAHDTSTGGIEGSYGYQVPAAVISVIGGGPTGGATITTPVLSATAGPLATGSAVTYTVTGANGAVTTQTTVPGTPSSSTDSSKGPNIGAIVAGVIAGVLFILVCYLLFCTYIYRKQVQLYKHHAEMAQRQGQNEKTSVAFGLLAGRDDSSSEKRNVGKPGHFSWAAATHSSRHDSGQGRFESGSGSAANSGYDVSRRSHDSDDLLAGHEPTFVGVMLNPRRSLRVINRD